MACNKHKATVDGYVIMTDKKGVFKGANNILAGQTTETLCNIEFFDNYKAMNTRHLELTGKDYIDPLSNEEPPPDNGGK